MRSLKVTWGQKNFSKISKIFQFFLFFFLKKINKNYFFLDEKMKKTNFFKKSLIYSQPIQKHFMVLSAHGGVWALSPRTIIVSEMPPVLISVYK